MSVFGVGAGWRPPQTSGRAWRIELAPSWITGMDATNRRVKKMGDVSLDTVMDERVQALETLYQRRYRAFRNTAATITGGYDSARDAVQEGFARALAARQQYRGDGSLEAWVWRIVLRVALEQVRVATGEVLDETVIDPQLVEPDHDPMLADALRELPPRRRLIVFLRYFADLDYVSIAEICQIDAGTVAATLAKARASLLESLSKMEVGNR
jgi:RNA polymerase sigma factor (sigma-70 family)